MAVDGIGIVVATPHVRADYPTTPDAMSEALATVRVAVAEAGIAIDVRGGGEIAIEQLDRLDPTDLARFGLGGNPRLVCSIIPTTVRHRRSQATALGCGSTASFP